MNAVFIGVLGMMLFGSGDEIGFVEDFALARDRSTALKQLIPGTEDYYYYTALHQLNAQQFARVKETLTAWIERHGRTERVRRIQFRHALLTYDQNPRETLQFLRNELGITHHHQRENLGVDPAIPDTLDPALINREAFVNRANSITQDDLSQFEDSALDWLAGYELSPRHRRSLLQRLTRPDYPNLVKMILADLKFENSPGFGAHPIHRLLLNAQLDELARLEPRLAVQQNFVFAKLARLQPGPDDDWRHDANAMEAYFDRVWAYVETLPSAYQSLKAHVLYHRLAFDLTQGVYDRARFLRYLQIPRSVHYIQPKYMERADIRQFPADLSADFAAFTALQPISNDETMVRTYLLHFLAGANDWREFEAFVADHYLKTLFAEAKITNGLGEPEQWASLLSAEAFQQLKDRIDIDFVPTNKQVFGRNESVKLSLMIKNVPTLIVKVFELNAKNYYRNNTNEINTDLNLDGLIANEEKTYKYEESPLRRVARQFEFPSMNRAGTYIVDFIGSGQSSRALIRKGRLRHLVQTGPSGQHLTVLTEGNEPLTDATLMIGGREYFPEKDGQIIVPFSAQAGNQSVVLCQGNIATLEQFTQRAEDYEFRCGMHVDRESLLARRKSELILRPAVYLNQQLITLSRLKDLLLTVTVTDLDGISSTQEIANFKIFEDREATYPFEVPANLNTISFTLTAKIKRLTDAKDVAFSVSRTFSVNEIDKSEQIQSVQLLHSDEGYFLDVLGKTGEARPSMPVQVTFKHRDFRQPFTVVLRSNAQGRVKLGSMPGITQVTTHVANHPQQWSLPEDRTTYPMHMNLAAGQSALLPHLGTSKEATRDEYSLLSVSQSTFVTDHFAAIKLNGGMIEVSSLPAGDYDLWLKLSNHHVQIHVLPGKAIEGWGLGGYVLSPVRQGETKLLKPIGIDQITMAKAPAHEDKNKPDEDSLTIQIRNPSKLTRVHVLASRYVPLHSSFTDLAVVRDSEPAMMYRYPAKSVYLTGRNIGDEYRYIIDRRYAPRFPGNLLDRPALLLNPWAVRSTATGVQDAKSGGEFKAVAPPTPSTEAKPRSEESQAAQIATAAWPNMDFLAEGSALILNLVPDAEGKVVVAKSLLKGHQHIQVLAIDPLNTILRHISFSEQASDKYDLRLVDGFDPAKHFTQQKQITMLKAGEKLRIEDVTTSRWEGFDSLARVHAVFTTLSKDPKLAEFAFIIHWDKYKLEQKREYYSKFACHELNFFLFRKDRPFFNEVVKPFLANKKEKTFLDHWLLGNSIVEYAKPWRFEQLNIVEKILLAQTLEAERTEVRKYVRDRERLLPPNVDEYVRLFDTGLDSGVLSEFGALGKKPERAVRILSKSTDPQMAGQAHVASSGRPTIGFEDESAPRGTTGGLPGGGGGRSPAKNGNAYRFAEELARRQVSQNEGGERGGRVDLEQARSYSIDWKAQAKENLADAEAGKVELFAKRIAETPTNMPNYVKLDKTMEWAENNYYQLLIANQKADLITVNGFWEDFAQHDWATPFLSGNFTQAHRNFTEMMFAMSVLDLPFEPKRHETKADKQTMEFTASGPIIVLHEEVKPAKSLADKLPILISQNFFKHGDRQRAVNGESVDNFLSDEFVIHNVYGCHLVVTNPTSSRQKLTVLLQIPNGALPVLKGRKTKTVHLTLEPYRTHTIEYYFYFPRAGKFTHYPAQAAKNSELVTSADPLVFNVLEKPTKVDKQSWDYISQFGSNDEVIAFLRNANLASLNLDRIAFRMQDQTFFKLAIELLAARHAYNHTLWSYAILHDVPSVAREYLQFNDQLDAICGGRIDSRLVTFDRVVRRTFEHLEYKPLVNARAHSLGKRRTILNDRFHQQYEAYMEQLCFSGDLSQEDLMAVTYYLLLQDRIEDAINMFGRINSANQTMALQYDYLSAYIAFYNEDLPKARQIALKHVNHAVDRWRMLFANMINQLDEAEGKGGKVVDEDDRNQRQAKLAASQPGLEFTVEGKQLKMTYQNLETIKISYFLMDVELLFSRNPFVQKFAGEFSSIRPSKTVEVKLTDKSKVAHLIAIPAEFANRNVVIEMVGGGISKTQAYYANSLAVQMMENFGQLKLTDPNNKPISKAYVKVYAQTNDGKVQFYKDGYTDVRGRFDYASLSTNEIDRVQRFAILVMSDEHGAQVREVAAPKQ